MIKFTDYAKIASNYCICYFGQSDEYLVQLKNLKPILEKEFVDLTIYIGCKDDKTNIFHGQDHILKLSELKIRKNDFAHISELKFNGLTHPVEDFILSSGIKNYSIPNNSSVKTTKCVIITSGSHPTKPLETTKIEKIKRFAITQGMSCELNTDVCNSGMVIGVESFGVCQAASVGIETYLIPTGIGTNLYKNMFPKIKIFDGT